MGVQNFKKVGHVTGTTLNDRNTPPYAVQFFRARSVEANDDRPTLSAAKRWPRVCRFQRRTDRT